MGTGNRLFAVLMSAMASAGADIGGGSQDAPAEKKEEPKAEGLNLDDDTPLKSCPIPGNGETCESCQ